MAGAAWRCVPMVFDSVAQKFPTIGNNRAGYQQMADVLSPMWAQFARTGNPNKPGLPEWRPYRAGERATMVFDARSRTEIDPVGIELALIDAYYRLSPAPVEAPGHGHGRRLASRTFALPPS